MLTISARLALLIPLATSVFAYSARSTVESSKLVSYTKDQTYWPSDWTYNTNQPVSPDEYIQLAIGLPQMDSAGLENTLLAISDPSSPSYGKFLSKDAALAFLKPKVGSSEAVEAWLQTHGLSISPPSQGVTVSSSGDWIDLNVTVATANTLLGTNFTAYLQIDDLIRTLRATSYTIPESLLSFIDTIQPTTIPNLGLGNLARRQAVGESSIRRRKREHRERGRELVHRDSAPNPYPNCTAPGIGAPPPSCIRQWYNVGNYTPLALPNNRIGVPGYYTSWAQREYLAEYLSVMNPTAAAANYSFSYASATDSPDEEAEFSYTDAEANLDTQIVAGLAYPIPFTYYYAADQGWWNPDLNTDSNTNEPYLRMISYLLSLPDDELPAVSTTSSGDDEQSVPIEYAKRVCTGFAALGARGVTVIYSSGDQGVGPDFDGEGIDWCLSNDGTNRTLFNPNFPASCPWVTTVGETLDYPEVGSLGSGGGFSQYFPMPDYQKSAVEGYLDFFGNKYSSYYNRSGRAFPDISSSGASNFVDIGYWQEGYGTSASAPTIAALFALLNDYRIRSRLSRLGFLNPLLYSEKATTGGGFNDITEGNNEGCGTNGFNATTGWDPVTGLGTLNFGNMLKVVIPTK